MASWKTSWDVGPEGFGRGEGGGQAGAAASRVTMVLAGASAGGGGIRGRGVGGDELGGLHDDTVDCHIVQHLRKPVGGVKLQ